jgi:hypothetical protein
MTIEWPRIDWAANRWDIAGLGVSGVHDARKSKWARHSDACRYMLATPRIQGEPFNGIAVARMAMRVWC